MFNFFIKKKKLINFKVTVLKPFEPTPEKVAASPRDFSTHDVKIAINNLEIEPKELEFEEFIKSANFILKDLFFSLHQTGLYNRQLKLWKSIGNITQIQLFELEKVLFKSQKLNIYILDFFVDNSNVSFRAIISHQENMNFETVKNLINLCLIGNNLKGVIVFVPENEENNDRVIKMLESHLKVKDSLDRYESILPNSQDVRLNIVSFKRKDDDYSFSHIFPYIDSVNKENKCKSLK